MTTATIAPAANSWLLTTQNDLAAVVVTGVSKVGAPLALSASTAGGALSAGANIKYTGAAAAAYTLPAVTAASLPINLLNTTKFPVTIATTPTPTVVQSGQLVTIKPNAAGSAWVASF